MHKKWAVAKEAIESILVTITLADIKNNGTHIFVTGNTLVLT